MVEVEEQLSFSGSVCKLSPPATEPETETITGRVLEANDPSGMLDRLSRYMKLESPDTSLSGFTKKFFTEKAKKEAFSPDRYIPDRIYASGHFNCGRKIAYEILGYTPIDFNFVYDFFLSAQLGEMIHQFVQYKELIPQGRIAKIDMPKKHHLPKPDKDKLAELKELNKVDASAAALHKSNSYYYTIEQDSWAVEVSYRERLEAGIFPFSDDKTRREFDQITFEPHYVLEQSDYYKNVLTDTGREYAKSRFGIRADTINITGKGFHRPGEIKTSKDDKKLVFYYEQLQPVLHFWLDPKTGKRPEKGWLGLIISTNIGKRYDYIVEYDAAYVAAAIERIRRLWDKIDRKILPEPEPERGPCRFCHWFSICPANKISPNLE
jgi:PD-(D/E)XK nuclease superfamily